MRSYNYSTWALICAYKEIRTCFQRPLEMPVLSTVNMGRAKLYTGLELSSPVPVASSLPSFPKAGLAFSPSFPREIDLMVRTLLSHSLVR